MASFCKILSSNGTNSDLLSIIRDDDYSTCLVLSPLLEAPWYTDFILPLYYINKTEIVTVELFGENIGCSSGDDAKFYIFPISRSNESIGLFGRRETCHFNELDVDIGTSQQKCSYRCQYSDDIFALRVIKAPYNMRQSEWKLCEVTNLIYENPVCRMGPIGLESGNTDDSRDCWITAGRRLPTGIWFNGGGVLFGLSVSYGDRNCSFGNFNRTGKKRYVELNPDELITEVTFYQDVHKVISDFDGFVGIEIGTNQGNVHRAGSKLVRRIFRGEDFLYFHGRSFWFINAVGVQFGKC
ncbi:hypothetical protein LSH36_193g09026 [Paralvinella palmiformis]|uniref:Jacalin-type lectin domain-containing protein n=1 Tax=Paralvinella palmiformis TaxID=53620 RepID=A0AAD9JQ64_9ANNE|nr:hypothetical protein LSH36_193g09026 [Paralvinella palmiformis]